MNKVIAILVAFSAASALADERFERFVVKNVDGTPAQLLLVRHKCATSSGYQYTQEDGSFEFESKHLRQCVFTLVDPARRTPFTVKSEQLGTDKVITLSWKVKPPPPKPPLRPLCLAIVARKTDCLIAATGNALDPLDCAELPAKLDEIARTFPAERALALSCAGCEPGVLEQVEQRAREAGFSAIVIGQAKNAAEVRDRCEAGTDEFPVKATFSDARKLLMACTTLTNVPANMREGLWAKACGEMAVCSRGAAEGSLSQAQARARFSATVSAVDPATPMGFAAQERCALVQWEQ